MMYHSGWEPCTTSPTVCLSLHPGCNASLKSFGIIPQELFLSKTQGWHLCRGLGLSGSSLSPSPMCNLITQDVIGSGLTKSFPRSQRAQRRRGVGKDLTKAEFLITQKNHSISGCISLCLHHWQSVTHTVLYGACRTVVDTSQSLN